MRQATIQATVPYLSLNSRVIRLDRGQPGGVNNPNAIPPFAPYRRRHVTIDADQPRASRDTAPIGPGCRAIERRFGVEPQVLMAIYGHETSYGAVTGRFDLRRGAGDAGL